MTGSNNPINNRPQPGWFASQQKGGIYACVIWTLAAIAFGYAFVHRVAPSVMVSDLMRDFTIGGAMIGTLSSLYFYPYVLLQIPLGALLETWGTRRLLSIALCLAAIGSVLFGYADNLYLAYMGRILIGMGSAVGFLGSLSLAARWFSPSYFGFLAGLAMFIGMSGGMLAQGPLALYVEYYGWRHSLFALGAFGFGLAVLVFLLVRNHPIHQKNEALSSSPRLSLRQIMTSAAQSKEVWKIAIVAATMSGPMLALGGLWGTPYLRVAYDLSRPEAAFLVSLLLLGWAVGAPAGGWLSDQLGRRKPILIFGCAMICLALMALIFMPTLSLAITVSLLVLIGLAGGVMACCFALVRDVMPSAIAGGATGIINSMTVASGAVLQPLIGVALDYQWSGKMNENIPVYAPHEYRTAFILVLISSFIGLVTAIRLAEPPIATNVKSH